MLGLFKREARVQHNKTEEDKQKKQTFRSQRGKIKEKLVTFTCVYMCIYIHTRVIYIIMAAQIKE